MMCMVFIIIHTNHTHLKTLPEYIVPELTTALCMIAR